MFEALLNVLPFRPGSRRARRASNEHVSRLEIESLEERCVPATVIRPISDFVDQQGTYCIDDGSGGCFLFVPPVENFLGWTDPKDGLGVSFDYAGLASDYLATEGIDLGTTFSGRVIERELADGRAEVTVILRTEDALTWAIDFNKPDDPDNPSDNPFGDFPLIFGARPLDVVDGATPALGDSQLKLTFINTEPGAPLPDLLQLLIEPEEGQEVLSLSFRGEASGELREEFGVPDGTPGKVNVVQTAIFHASFKGATADGFPAENIVIRPVGGGDEAAAVAALDSVFGDSANPGRKKR